MRLVFIGKKDFNGKCFKDKKNCDLYDKGVENKRDKDLHRKGRKVEI